MKKRTWRDNYPTGRKHCSNCKRWRHVVDFNVRKWVDEPECTTPLTLTSVCVPCQGRIKRKKNGSQRREKFPYGLPDSEKYREHRRKMNRESNKKRRERKTYREVFNEYNRIWRNAKIAEQKGKDALLD